MALLKRRKKQEPDWACPLCGPPNSVHDRVRDVVMMLPSRTMMCCGRCGNQYRIQLAGSRIIPYPDTWFEAWIPE